MAVPSPASEAAPSGPGDAGGHERRPRPDAPRLTRLRLPRMRVTLIRHAEAGDDAPRDELRSLTMRGRDDARRAGARAAPARRRVLADASRARSSAPCRPPRSSPPSVGYGGRVVVTERWSPRGPPSLAAARGRPRDARGEDSIALVAHEPILSAAGGRAARQRRASRRCARPRRCASASRRRAPAASCAGASTRDGILALARRRPRPPRAAMRNKPFAKMSG